MNSFIIYYGTVAVKFFNMDCGCLQYGVDGSFGSPHLLAIVIIIIIIAAAAVEI